MPRNHQKIPVSDLRLGMYVVKLDRPWISTPFDRHGFPINSAAQIKLLAKYCKAVHVEATRPKARRASAPVKKAIALTRKAAASRKPAQSKSRSRSAARAR